MVDASVLEKRTLAAKKIADRHVRIAYVCGDDVDDFINLPLLWNTSSELAIIRARNAGNAEHFWGMGWRVISPRRLSRENWPDGSSLDLGDQRFLFGKNSLARQKGQHEIDPDRVHVATSGTTSAPRYVQLSKTRLIANARASVASFGDALDNRVLSPNLSLGSSYGLAKQLLTPCLYQIPVDILMFERIANPVSEYMRRADRFILVASPTQLHNYVMATSFEKSASGGRGLLTFSCGGDFLHPATINLIIEKLGETRIAHTYGLTQLGPRVSTCIIDASVSDDTLGDVGELIPGVKAICSREAHDHRAAAPPEELYWTRHTAAGDTPTGRRFANRVKRSRIPATRAILAPTAD